MQTNQIPEFVNEQYLRALRFRSGKGTGKEGDRCSIQEYRSWLGLDPRYDKIPEEDSAVVGGYIIGFQDRIINADATPEQVYEFVGRHLPKLRFSGRSAKLEKRRSFLLNDILIREALPLWLEAHPELLPFAERLRALPEIVDSTTYEAASSLRDEARSAAWDVRRKAIATLQAKARDALSQAMPTGHRDRDLKLRAVAAADAAAVADAAADAAAVAAADAAAVAVADAAADAVADAAADAAAVAAAAAAAIERLDGETDDAFYWRVYDSVRYRASYDKVYKAAKEELLSTHRERIAQSWALGGKFIETALAMRDDSEAA
jgi:hypothetical protein